MLLFSPYRDILSGTVSRGADRFRDGRYDRRGRFRSSGSGVSEAGQGSVVRDEKTEKTVHRRYAATGARVQRENHTGIV